MNGTTRIAPGDPEAFFAGSRLGLAVYRRVRSITGARHDVEVRATRSQVAFRRSRGFAFLWRPDQYLAAPTAEVVLSIALDRREPSPRFKEVVQVPGRHWMHHLEIHRLADVDDEVEAWLREAADAAAPRPRPDRLAPVATG